MLRVFHETLGMKFPISGTIANKKDLVRIVFSDKTKNLCDLVYSDAVTELLPVTIRGKEYSASIAGEYENERVNELIANIAKAGRGFYRSFQIVIVIDLLIKYPVRVLSRIFMFSLQWVAQGFAMAINRRG